MLVIFEGLDGSGKSTLLKKVAESIPSAITTKEPGSLHVGCNSTLRQIVLENKDLSPLERELLFYVDASQHSKFVEEKRGQIVLSDRGLLSHLAYLRGYLKTKAIDFDEYHLCKKLIDRCCAKPDLIVYLSGTLELMRQRTSGRPLDAIESNGPVFYHHVLETYEDLVSNEWATKTLVLNATDTIDENVFAVLSYLQEEGHAILSKEQNS